MDRDTPDLLAIWSAFLFFGACMVFGLGVMVYIAVRYYRGLGICQ